jgi:hypothetical protein
MNTEPPTSSTPLLDAFLKLLDGWAAAFCQHRTHQRAIRLALAHVLTPGHRMISRLITSCGRQERDWSADYKLFSRSPWLLAKLFAPVLAAGLRHTAAEPFIHIAGDMTHVRKTGKKIPGVHYMRDPMSPPFHVNLIRGLRFLQFTLVTPLYKKNPDASPRSIPVLFEEVPALAKPGKKATDDEKQAHAQAKKQPRGMLQTIEALKGLRRHLDDEGCTKPLIATLDGSFCNRTLFGAELPRTELVCRARKDARLCFRSAEGGRRFYDPHKFTPEEVRKNDEIAWQTGSFFHGGMFRELRYKEVNKVHWQGGAKRRPLRLFVIAPTPYRNHKNGPTHYRQEAYLLTTDLETPAAELIQAYFDHWQIEVNHREEKSNFGIGDAQVRNKKSVPRQPAFGVAIYAMLLLAALEAYGTERTSDYLPLPKWRKGAKRPSCADIIAQLRREMDEAGSKLIEFEPRERHLTPATLMAAA